MAHDLVSAAPAGVAVRAPVLDPEIAEAVVKRRDNVRALRVENAATVGRAALSRPNQRESWVALAALSILMLERYPAEPVPPDMPGLATPPLEAPPDPRPKPAQPALEAPRPVPELDFTGALADRPRPRARFPYPED